MFGLGIVVGVVSVLAGREVFVWSLKRGHGWSWSVVRPFVGDGDD